MKLAIEKVLNRICPVCSSIYCDIQKYFPIDRIKWRNVFDSYGSIHVMPFNLKNKTKHIKRVDCFCNPKIIDCDEGYLIVHNHEEFH